MKKEPQSDLQKIAYNACVAKLAIVREIMNQKKIDQKTLAESIGVDASMLSKWLTNEAKKRVLPNQFNFELLLAGLGVNHYFESKDSSIDFNVAFEKAMSSLDKN